MSPESDHTSIKNKEEFEALREDGYSKDDAAEIADTASAHRENDEGTRSDREES